MIFKHLFRSKHQSPNPQVRIQAIENLNKQDPEQKSILHELAFNDSDVNVSLAALQKLDSFVLWYKMSEIAKNDRVLKRSQKVVEDTLFKDKSELLSDAEKRKFVLECRDNRLLEKLLQQSWIQQDTDLTLQLLKKIDKPQVEEKLLLESHDEALKLALLSRLKDGTQQRKLLNRLIKKTQLHSIVSQSKQILASWLDAEALPLDIERQVKMILSRLLALKDNNDLPVIKTQRDLLVKEYQQLAEQFDCLNDVKRQELEQKYADITHKISRTIELLMPEWQAKVAAIELQKQIDTTIANVEQLLEYITQQLATRIRDITESESQDLLQQLTANSQALQSLVPSIEVKQRSVHQRIELLQNQLSSSQHTLENLSEFQNAIVNGQSLLAKLQELTLPSDQSQIEAAQEFANDLKYQWKEVVGDYISHIPTELADSWRNLNKDWQQAIKQLKTQLNAEVSRCRNKIRAVDSLIQQGKFKAAMGLFQRVQLWFAALPEKQQSQLEKSFLMVKEQIENLQDWQEYIAAPRKPALLKEVESLIAKPLEIEQQATAIKALRAQWNSLGKLDSESDQALNQAFDKGIEQAFEPCRKHYELQQQQRAANLVAKQALLTELKALNESDVEHSEIAKSLRSLQQKWKKIGEVDYKLRNDIYQQYQQLTSPLKDKVNQFYLHNQEQKQKLLDQALALVELESVSEAIEQVKVLQKQWKSIEHAGRKAEAELWPAFRKANDQVFAKRKAENQQQKALVDEQLVLVKDKLSQLEQSLASATDKATVQNALQTKVEIDNLMLQLPASEQKVLQARLKEAKELQKQKLMALQTLEKRQHLTDIFSILHNWPAESELLATIKVLPKAWQGCFINPVEGVKRLDLTIKMEILAQVESPASDAGLRQDIQLQLMAKKLQSGEAQELNTLLKEWISAGQVSAQDKKLLARLEIIFLN